MKLILLELSRALDERGDDVNAAALELRPAMVAANEALAEVESQNAALRSVIEDAEDVSAQAAKRRVDLANMIDSLETTLGATASRNPQPRRWTGAPARDHLASTVDDGGARAGERGRPAVGA